MVYRYPNFADYFIGKQLLPTEIMIKINDYRRAAFIKHARSLKLQRRLPVKVYEATNGVYLDWAVCVAPYVIIFIYIKKQLVIKALIRIHGSTCPVYIVHSESLGYIVHSELLVTKVVTAAKALNHLYAIVS